VGLVEKTSARVAIVTGAAGGIGRSVVVDLLAQGYVVVGIGRSAPTTPIDGAHFELADVSVAADVERAVTNTLDRFGRIDVLVTSAAVLKTGPVHTMEESLWDEVMDINLKGVFLSCRAVLPAMIAAGSGSIVNLSSVHAIATVPGTGAYAATKGAIISFSRQLAIEYADAGIRSNSVVVGSVDTAMSTAHGAAMARDGVVVASHTGRLARMARPDEIAKTVRFLAGEDSSFVTGSAVTVDGGLLSRLM
jgi:NAD(P)-dependent dehydrogenase (short-subunit alcohol dehydrogenase family)